MRQQFLDPGRFIKFVSPEKTDIIADIGAGDGYYSVLLSPFVSEVHAFDSQHDSMKLVPDNTNIRKHRKDVCEGLPKVNFSKVIFVNSFHDLSCRQNLLRQLSEEIRPGKLIFMEFKKADTGIGPPLEIRLSEEDLDLILSPFRYFPAKGEEMGIFYLRKYERA
ncbi:MAG: hypothetical protein QW812_06200 [Thermoplasmataceae archaeon]